MFLYLPIFSICFVYVLILSCIFPYMADSVLFPTRKIPQNRPTARRTQRPPKKHQSWFEFGSPPGVGGKGAGSASLSLTQLRVDASRSCGSKGGGHQKQLRTGFSQFSAGLGEMGEAITTPKTVKQLILKTAVHENILAGPLRDAYGTAVDWFYMTRDFRETSACSTITICAKYNTYE